MSVKFVLALVAVLAALAVTDARRAYASDYVNAYYSRQKVMESCFGRDYVKEQDAKIRSARETCNNQPSRAYLDEPKSEANFEYAQPQVEESYGVQKPYFTQQMVRYLSERLLAKTSNATCILRELNYMNDADVMNYDGIRDDIYALPRSESSLKRDLGAGLEDCKAMAECLPLNEIAYALTPSLMRWSTFSKCYMSMTYQSCMKRDLVENAGEFELEGLGGFLEDYADREKMWSIVWARTVLDQGADFLW